MMTVHEVSRISGVSIRTLHHYDSIGLLKPTALSESGYRLYDDEALERLQQILIFKALEFPLKEIGRILDSPAYDRSEALDMQIRLLEMKEEHIRNLIDLARGIKLTGVKTMSFEAFDTRKIDEYARQAKEAWGKSPAYREFEQKTANSTKEEMRLTGNMLMDIMARFGALREESPSGAEAQSLVAELQAFITAHFYTCTDEILQGLGAMYAGGGEMTENIDRAGGRGTAAFIQKAIAAKIEEC